MVERDIPSENASNHTATVEHRGFKPYEILEIEAENLFKAYTIIGKKGRWQAREILQEYYRDGVPRNRPKSEKLTRYNESLVHAQLAFERLKRFAQTDIFTTSDGLNHLERYIQTVEGFAQGAEISIAEAALLQMENEAGCQTVWVKNTHTGEVLAIHTEEDSDQYFRSSEVRKRKERRNKRAGKEIQHIQSPPNPSIGKRWIKLQLPDQTVEYCAFAGLAGYGAASGIITRHGQNMWQAADIIDPEGKGPIWGNAMAFMLMDAGSIKYATELRENMIAFFAHETIFTGGYVIHQIEASNPVQTQTVEFGGNSIILLKSHETDGREFNYGVNYPQSQSLQMIDAYELSEDEDDQAEKRLMQRRQKRLALMAQLVARDGDQTSLLGDQRAQKLLHEVIQNAGGDLTESEWYTALSNDLVAQNISLSISPEGRMHVVVRKGYSEVSLRNYKRRVRQ